jgi:two-component system repressor protein LuxO
VFITGESGTGKELCAEAIHKESERKNNAFVAINCAAIPRDLMESEIFGHVKGAFTGAHLTRQGAASSANGGTLFLDEICDMDTDLQTKFLRFIQTGSYQPVGSSELKKADIRFICATNKDPLKEVAAGRFREDLYYRLHVIPITLPSLRKRDADVMMIARKFLIEYSEEEGKHFKDFMPETESVFLAYNWPGNVRQLQNVMRNIVVLNDGESVMPEMLPPPLNTFHPQITHSNEGAPMKPSSFTTSSTQKYQTILPNSVDNIRPLADIEREIIERSIDLCNGNIPKAAIHLGISASTIYRKKQNWDAIKHN